MVVKKTTQLDHELRGPDAEIKLGKSRIFVSIGVALLLTGIVLASFGVNLSSAGPPPVDVNYGDSRLVYQSGSLYDSIALYNHGSQQVSVVVSIKTGLDISPRTSNPVQICTSCTAHVLILELQPVSTQTPEQIAQMVNFMTHPDSIEVYYASSPTTESNIPAVTVGIILILAAICLIVYSVKGNVSRSLNTYDYGPSDEYDYSDYEEQDES